MSTVHAGPSNSLILHGIDWQTYARLLRLFDERRSMRLTYDRGDLEIMTLSPEHENLNLLLNHLVTAAAEELGLEIASYGSMTMRRRGRRRGLEADQCYWIANEARMRGQVGENALVRQFRDWIRQQLAGGTPPQPAP